MTEPSTRYNRLIELDACRGIAAFGVVLFHYTVRYSELYGHPSDHGVIMPTGHLWVAFFFMISGFVIELTLERTNKARDFIVARFARLYPTYWVCMLVTMVTVYFLGLPNREVTWTTWFINLTMLNGFASIPYVDGVYWSLRVELSFYIIAFATYFLAKRKYVTPLMSVWLLLHAAYVYLPELSSSPVYRAGASLGAVSYSDLFIAGIIYLRIFRREARIFDICLLLAAIGLRIYISTTIEAAMILIFNAILLSIIFDKARLLRFKPLIWLGTVSYPLYLVHQNVGYAVMRHLYAYGTPTWVGIVLAIALALSISWAIHQAVEVPARRWIREAYKKWTYGGSGIDKPIGFFIAFHSTPWKLSRRDMILASGLILFLVGIALFKSGFYSNKPICNAQYQAIIIGDSVSIHYADRAAYSEPEEWCISHSGMNAQSANNALKHFDELTQGRTWHAVILNVGLWDAIDFDTDRLTTYEEQVSQLMQRANSAADHVLWVETTPVLDARQIKRKDVDIIALNAIAKEQAKAHNVIWVETRNLFNLDHEQKLHYGDGVHLSPQGSALMAQRIAESIRYLE